MLEVGIGHNNPPVDDMPPCPSGIDPNGWVAIHRSIIDHWLVGFGQPAVKPADPSRGAFSRSEFFLFLILAARYRDGYVNNAGRKMLVRRGELRGATSWLASVANWTPKTVRGFLDKLEAEGMISRQQPEAQEGHVAGNKKGRLPNIISIRKYAHFQDVHRQQGQVDGEEQGRLRAGYGQVKGDIYKEEQSRTREQDAVEAACASARDPGRESAKWSAIQGPDFDRLQARLLEAANGSLANPAIAPGLLTLAEPLIWLDGGADLERDVLPAIVEISAQHKARARAKPISSWAYFRHRVAELKAAREAGLPTLVIDQTGPTGVRGKSKFEMLQEAADRINARSRP